MKARQRKRFTTDMQILTLKRYPSRMLRERRAIYHAFSKKKLRRMKFLHKRKIAAMTGDTIVFRRVLPFGWQP